MNKRKCLTVQHSFPVRQAGERAGIAEGGSWRTTERFRETRGGPEESEAWKPPKPNLCGAREQR